jgi:hypothetical protein
MIPPEDASIVGENLWQALNMFRYKIVPLEIDSFILQKIARNLNYRLAGLSSDRQVFVGPLFVE